MKLLISQAPHATAERTTQKVMYHVLIALAPCLIASMVIFGLYPFVVTALCVVTCVLSEHFFCLATKQKTTISDLSAVVTGVILGLNLPPVLPLYIPVVGSFFAILVVKMLFGGIGKNFANPACTARVFLLLAWTPYMTKFVLPIDLAEGAGEMIKYFSTGQMVDVLTGATPLNAIANGNLETLNLLDLFLGNHAGTAGEVCILAVLLGGLYLGVLKIIDLRIPLTIILSTTIFTLAFYGSANYIMPSLLSGGVMFGAFFMATDYVTCPTRKLPRYVFSIMIGFLAVLFRKFSGMPEGMSFAILLMNICAPLLDKIPNIKFKKKTSVTTSKKEETIEKVL